jgi:hypothetical protein
MSIKAYCILHYGKEYLERAIKAVEPLVEEIHIVYTSVPSHGTRVDVVCPDTRDELKEVAENASDLVVWHEGVWNAEGNHRDAAISFCGECDQIVVFDADEVWDTNALDRCLKEAAKLDARNIGVLGWINFWRDETHYCEDSFAPVRIIQPNRANTQFDIWGKIYHYGCAQNADIMRYKYLIHGHKDEIRPNWLDEVYFSDRMEDLHPVAIGLWNAKPYTE